MTPTPPQAGERAEAVQFRVVAWMDSRSAWPTSRAPADGLNALVLADDYAAIVARLDAAEVDARRLDFLDANPRAVWRSSGYREHVDSWAYKNINGCTKDTGSLRDAIDAAIAALDSEESK